MFHRELLICWTHTGPGGLKLLILVVLQGTSTGDEYCSMLDDGNVAGEKALPGLIVTQAAGILGIIGASCKPELVDIRTVLGRWLPPGVSANNGQQ